MSDVNIKIINSEDVKKRNSYSFGRTKLTIPGSSEKLTKEKIKRYLPKLIKQHQFNVTEFNRLLEMTKGQSQKINTKERNGEKEENNIVIENHALSMTLFKQGYIFGEKIKYSSKKDIDNTLTEEIKQLTDYLDELDKRGLDNEMAYNLFVGGVANRLILPEKSTDPEVTAPFQIYDLDFTSSFVVYSSGYTKEKLFGVIINELEEDVDQIIVYTRKKSYEFKRTKNDKKEEITFVNEKSHIIGYVPMVEYITNNARLGVGETVESILDAVNSISSDSIDNVNDYVNAIFYVKNMRMDDQAIKLVNSQRAIEILTNDPARPADAGYIANKLDLTDVQAKYDSLLTAAYDIVGVPLASQSTSSGGDTGEARMLGGGWTRAEIVAQQDVNSFQKTEKELLKIILSICIHSSSSKIQNLKSKDIDVVFTRNMNVNLLVKTQSLQYLVAMHMPKEEALKIVQLTSNPHEVAIAWEKKIEENEEKAMQQNTKVKQSLENKKVNPVFDTSIKNNNIDNKLKKKVNVIKKEDKTAIANQ